MDKSDDGSCLQPDLGVSQTARGERSPRFACNDNQMRSFVPPRRAVSKAFRAPQAKSKPGDSHHFNTKSNPRMKKSPHVENAACIHAPIRASTFL
jgi:hypothetical protein